MIDIIRIGHVALDVSDVGRTSAFLVQALGLAETARVDGVAHLRHGREHHNISLHPVAAPGTRCGLRHVGFELAAGSLDRAERFLREQGVAVTEAPAQSGRGRGLQLRDPAGLCLELYDVMEQVSRGVEPGPVGLRKLSHVTLKAPSPKAMADFYTATLGFSMSDWLGTRFAWMRCNADHHAVAVTASDGPSGLHHFAFDLVDWSEIKRACDHLYGMGVRLEAGPVRHGPGHNIAIYFRDPDGLRIELTCEMEQILHRQHRSLEWPSAGTFDLWHGASAPSTWAD